MTGGQRPVLLCLTPAPAIDRTAHVERLELGVVLRPRTLVALPGGKGVNAARAAVRLGAPVITSGIAGGHAGRWIVEALATEGLAAEWSFAAEESRTTYVTVDDAGRSLLVYERPGSASPAELEAFLRLLRERLLPRCGWVILAGSPPAGVDPGAHAAIVEACHALEKRILVDASGPALMAALGAAPDVVKIGRVEAVETGIVPPHAGSREAAVALVERGAALGVVTDGQADVWAADARTTWQLTVPRVRVVNPVGSGDSFNAALSLALVEGAEVTEALARGVAAGSANALTLSAADLDPGVARALVREVTVSSRER